MVTTSEQPVAGEDETPPAPSYEPMSVRTPALIVLGTVAVSPATERMRAIEANGEPPADILGNLGVLTGSTVTGVVNSDQDAAQFDRTVDLTSTLAQDQVAEAYRRLLTASNWNVIFQGPAPQGVSGTTEVLAKKGSGDGFYWETGVVVSPTPAGSTPYTIEVFETPDGN